MKPAISISGLSKQYTLGSEAIAGQSFREMVINSISSPIKKFRRLSGNDEQMESFWALKDINFDVQAGEVVGIIGRNGAGKSTLLKVLSRITTPTRGQIEYQGRMASLLEVGTGFHPELTGRENIYLNGAILGMTRTEINQRMEQIVDFAEISKFLDTPVKRYSSGMYVRLAFSVAAHLDPEILVVDEVLAVGDQAFQQKCLGKLQDTAGDGRTVFFVSHNMTAVKSLCSRIIYLKDGQIEADGSPQTAIGEYLKTSGASEGNWSDGEGSNTFLKRVSLHVDGKSNSNLIQFNDSAELSITVNHIKAQEMIVAARITDVFGNPIFTSCDMDTLKIDRRKFEGERTYVCTLPTGLLKPGNYNLSALVRYQSARRVWAEEEASLDLTISSEQCPIPDGRLGLVTPMLPWKLQD